MSLSYNISVPIFGGFAPFFAQSMIDLKPRPVIFNATESATK
jgi:hypothetical protein